jgi:hypothetical protein
VEISDQFFPKKGILMAYISSSKTLLAKITKKFKFRAGLI